jgi:hypothetical protein
MICLELSNRTLPDTAAEELAFFFTETRFCYRGRYLPFGDDKSTNSYQGRA